jgi:enoyl-CoA hydratase/carnithine racemase
MKNFESVGSFSTLWLGINSSKSIGVLRLNKSTRNTMTLDTVKEIPVACAMLENTESVRAVVLCAAGKHFCAGLDFRTMHSVTAELLGKTGVCPAQTRLAFLQLVKQMQVRSSCDIPTCFGSLRHDCIPTWNSSREPMLMWARVCMR